MLSDFMDFVGCFVNEIICDRKYLSEINCKYKENFSENMTYLRKMVASSQICMNVRYSFRC